VRTHQFSVPEESPPTKENMRVKPFQLHFHTFEYSMVPEKR